jgi:hypothetical protein
MSESSVLNTRNEIRYLVNSNNIQLINDQGYWKNKYESHFGKINFEVSNWFQLYQYESNKRILYINSHINNDILSNFVEYSTDEDDIDEDRIDIVKYPDENNIDKYFHYREVYFGKVIQSVKIYKNMICIIDSDHHLWIGGIDIENMFGFSEKLGNFYSNFNILVKDVYLGQYIIFFIDLQDKLYCMGKKSKYLYHLDHIGNELYNIKEMKKSIDISVSTPTFTVPVPTPTFITPVPTLTFITPVPTPTFNVPSSLPTFSSLTTSTFSSTFTAPTPTFSSTFTAPTPTFSSTFTAPTPTFNVPSSLPTFSSFITPTPTFISPTPTLITSTPTLIPLLLLHLFHLLLHLFHLLLHLFHLLLHLFHLLLHLFHLLL